MKKAAVRGYGARIVECEPTLAAREAAAAQIVAETGAMLIPLPEIQDRHAEIPDAGTVYVICRSGGRSMVASQFLVTVGRDPVNVAGGTDGWIQAGHPVVTGPERS